MNRRGFLRGALTTFAAAVAAPFLPKPITAGPFAMPPYATRITSFTFNGVPILIDDSLPPDVFYLVNPLYTWREPLSEAKPS